MGYQFKGFFAQADITLIEAANNKWLGCPGKVITNPFNGIGVSSPNLAARDPEAAIQASEIAYAMEDELPQWSTNYPDITFIFIHADCFGGICDYQGYVCKNGKIITQQKGDRALANLVQYLGAKLSASEYFAPFERNFFNNVNNSASPNP